jgi:uncharacterized membrane protein YcjF (UPF0283 family)
MKYCNRCGALVGGDRESGEKKGRRNETLDERLDRYLTDIFWVSVFGLALIAGGIFLLSNAFQLSGWLVTGYMILSSTAFGIMFGLHLWEIIRMLRVSNQAKRLAQDRLNTDELPPAERPALEFPPSITENTTRGLEASSVLAPRDKKDQPRRAENGDAT